MYRPRASVSDAELSALGLTREDISNHDDEDFVLYAQNLPAFEVFSAVSTQWRVGMNGRTGLDYAVLPAVMDMMGIQADSRRQMFEDVQAMEYAALKEMK